MRDREAWLRNIDKIAYVVAGIVGVAFVAGAVLMGGGASSSATSLVTQSAKLEEKVEKWEPENVELPKWETELRRQWQKPPAASANPEWLTERPQFLVRLYDTKPPENCLHHAPVVASIECGRDADKKGLFLRVTGSLAAENKGVDVKKLVIVRRVGEGEWEDAPEAGLVLEPSGAFVYTDTAVEAGMTYSFKARSHAEPREGCVLSAEEKAKESAEQGPTPKCPYELEFAISTFEPDTLSPKVLARLNYYDYASGKVVLSRSYRSFAEGEKFGERDRFEIKRVDPDAKEVQIKDTWRQGKLLTLKPMKPGTLPVASWEPIGPGVAPDAGATPPPKSGMAQKPAAGAAALRRPDAASKPGAAGAGSKAMPKDAGSSGAGKGSTAKEGTAKPKPKPPSTGETKPEEGKSGSSRRRGFE